MELDIGTTTEANYIEKTVQLLSGLMGLNHGLLTEEDIQKRGIGVKLDIHKNGDRRVFK